MAVAESVRQVLDPNRDHPQRELAGTVRVEAPTVPVVDLVVTAKVDLHRVRMCTEETEEVS